MHRDQLVELERPAVLHERFQNRRLQSGLAPLGERVTDVAEVLDARLFEVVQVVAVVHDAHRVGLDETDTDLVAILVVIG